MMKKQDHNIEEGMLFAAEDINKREGEADPLTPKKRGRKRSTKTESRPPLTAEQMREMLTEIKEVETATGIRYVNFRLTKKMLIGIRESSGKEFTLNLEELHKAYEKCLRFTSPEVKRYIFMGHSPAVAILKLLKAKVEEKLT